MISTMNGTLMSRKDKRVPYTEKKRLYPQWCVLKRHSVAPTSCIIALPGRGQSGFSLASLYNAMGLSHTMVIGLTPTKFEWYPMPNGIKDQKAAVVSQHWSMATIADVLKEVQIKYKIGPDKMALVGYSAGAVMSIHTAINLAGSVSAVVAHAGAILEPWRVQQCLCPNTHFLLIHSLDDEAFKWDERYLPMKESLTENAYNVCSIEKENGGHGIYFADIRRATGFIANKFGYGDDVVEAFLT